MGKMIDVFGWKAWNTSLIIFAVGGGLLMCLVWKVGGKGSTPAEREDLIEV